MKAQSADRLLPVFTVSSSQSKQRGVAALTVVMVLFFVMAMVAAYTSRNMVFEQRTSVNQLRSTQALEAAQAGIEWATALLNAGRINSACTETGATTGDSTFRERYLTVSASSGAITRKVRSVPTIPPTELLPTCVSNAGVWSCSCPVDGAPSVAAPAGTETSPAFRIRFLNVASQPGIVRIESNGCTRLDDECLNFPARSSPGEGRATISALIGLKSGLSTPPLAAVVARSDVSGAMSIYNSMECLPGATSCPSRITVQSGASVTVPPSNLFAAAGTPGELSIIDNDPTLAAAALPVLPWPIGDRLFASVFAMWPSTYKDQPAALRPDCGAGQCTAAFLRTLASMNPNRVIWIDGNLSVATADDIGTIASPVILVVTGNITFTASATIYGVVYGARSSVATPAFGITGPGVIRGAVIAEHGLVGTSAPIVQYDKGLVDLLRYTSGSMVLVPGSWRDFPEGS